jgi:hypothetical protein
MVVYLKGNMPFIALEPKSMQVELTYKQFGYLLKTREKYLILRMVRQQ